MTIRSPQAAAFSRRKAGVGGAVQLWLRLLSVQLVLLLVFLAGVLYSPVVLLGRTPPPWAPVWLRNYAFDLRLWSVPLAKKASSILRGAWGDDRLYWDTAGEVVSFTSDGLEITGTLYAPAGEGKRAGLVLVHGSTAEGRKLGLYRLLGRELSEQGYVVLSIDTRGYGDSEDPKDLSTVDSFLAVADIQAAAAYLAKLQPVDPQAIYVIGHSGGADDALAATIEDPAIRKVIAIGPPRRVKELTADPQNSEQAYFQRRMERYMGLPQSISPQVFQQMGETMIIETHLDYLMSDDHKPIMLIDGAVENQADQDYLAEIYAQMTSPKAYFTLAGADHYANSANFGALVIYDQHVTDQLVQAIDAWLLGDGG